MSILERWLERWGYLPAEVLHHWHNERGDIVIVSKSDALNGIYLIVFFGDGLEVESSSVVCFDEHLVDQVDSVVRQASMLARLAGMEEVPVEGKGDQK
jgi:hypothetical protein